jgi:putative copper resistance protein D
MEDATLAALRTAAAAVSDIGFATMVGTLATRALLGDTASDWAMRCLRRCRRTFVRAGWVTLAAGLAWMVAEALAMTEAPLAEALPGIGDIVLDTPFGRAWAVATLALAFALALLSLRPRRAPPLRTLALALVVSGVAHACAGHAGANGLGVATAVMGAHVLATAMWAGAVFTAVLCAARGVPDAGDGPRYAARLSSVATWALAVVALTGAWSAWRGLGGSVAPLASSTWGQVLDVKLALVAATVALGGFNRFVVLPTLPRAWPRFARILRLEAALLAAVLVAAALLSNGEPPAP